MPEVGQVEVGEVVAVVDEEGFVEEVGDPFHRTGGAQQLFFQRVSDFYAPVRAVAEVVLDDIGEVIEVDDHFVEAVLGQQPHDVFEHWLAGEGDHRFGRGVGEWPQPGAAAGCEDHRLHDWARRMILAARIFCSVSA